METIDTELLLLFWSAMAINAATVALYFTRRNTVWLFVIPWIGLILGIIYFANCQTYFDQQEVQLSVPIRVDLVMLPPLMLFSGFSAAARLVKLITGKNKSN